MYVCKLWDLSYFVNKYDDFSCFYKRKVEIKRAGQLAMDKKIGSWLHILSKKENQWCSATELVWHARHTYLTWMTSPDSSQQFQQLKTTDCSFHLQGLSF